MISYRSLFAALLLSASSLSAFTLHYKFTGEVTDIAYWSEDLDQYFGPLVVGDIVRGAITVSNEMSVAEYPEVRFAAWVSLYFPRVGVTWTNNWEQSEWGIREEDFIGRPFVFPSGEISGEILEGEFLTYSSTDWDLYYREAGTVIGTHGPATLVPDTATTSVMLLSILPLLALLRTGLHLRW